jgi:hypothetical protein
MGRRVRRGFVQRCDRLVSALDGSRLARRIASGAASLHVARIRTSPLFSSCRSRDISGRWLSLAEAAALG